MKQTVSKKITSIAAGAFLALSAFTAPTAEAQLAKGKCKYLGNIIAGSARSDYNSLWNAVTSENDCKWGSVEGTRNQMNWAGADRAYNHAKTNGFKFRWHALAWGSQYPSWLTSLSPADFKKEMEEYMKLVSDRYEQGKYFDQIDVLNEQLGTHAAGTSYFRNGLGGNGTTGYDWQIWLFTTARKYFPGVKLVLNDYGLENDQNAIRDMLKLVKALKDRNLIDGFGTQAHEFNINTLSAAQLKSSLDLMATGGVPIYVTELDISASDETTQANRYKTLFPVYWEHPNVAGITLWGYVTGATWKEGTGIINSNGTDRAAMKWLKTYMASQPNCVTGVEDQEEVSSTTAFTLFPNPVNDVAFLKSANGTSVLSDVKIINALGETVKYFEFINSDEGINTADLISGIYFVEFISENKRKRIKMVK